jgi:hypothetical protein
MAGHMGSLRAEHGTSAGRDILIGGRHSQVARTAVSSRIISRASAIDGVPNSGSQDQTNPVDDPGNYIFRQTYMAINNLWPALKRTSVQTPSRSWPEHWSGRQRS